MPKGGYVYIMGNETRTTLYIGVTNNIERRAFEHKTGQGSEFTSKYRLTHLLYFEEFGDIVTATAREKQLKNWRREWKIALIKSQNPAFTDLAKDWFTKKELDFARNLPA